MYKKLKDIDADIYHTVHIDQLLLCLLLKKNGKKVIVEIQEDHPYSLYWKSKAPKWIIAILVFIMKLWMTFVLKKIKVMSIFGTRPEAIKMAPLVKEFEKYAEDFKTIVCVTGQHRQMLDQVLDIFEIKPDYDLNIMKDRQTLLSITTRGLEGLDAVMKEAKPNIVLVHGDTSTTFVGSLAAFYNQIPVGHVEAGLRTYDKYSPFPEEVNRRLTGVIADMHFSPTINNKNNRENLNTIFILVFC